MQKPTKTASKRTATIERRTKETAITATVDLDGSGAYAIETGVGVSCTRSSNTCNASFRPPVSRSATTAPKPLL